MHLFGAIIRALLVVIVVAIPSLLLPSASQGAIEFALIIGSIVGIFAFFEYGTTNPGFIDFRFAPPYNRYRAFTIGAQILSVTILCRAIELNLHNAVILDWAQTAAFYLDFPYSPVSEAINVALQEASFSSTTAVSLVYSISASFAVGMGLTVLFAAILWVFNWPRDKENFNLWSNLPMFQPSEGVSVTKRLRRDAYFNVILAIVLIYALPYIPMYGFDWLTVDMFENNQALVWAATFWVFIPSSLLARAAAMLKIARIISRAQVA